MHKMPQNQNEQDLQAQLAQMVSLITGVNRHNGNSQDWQAQSIYELTTQKGVFFDVPPHPIGQARHTKIKECFANAMLNAMESKGKLLYCEGFAFNDDIGLAIHHAWNLDTDTLQVADFTGTWRGRGLAYCGILFELNWAIRFMMANKVYGILDGKPQATIGLLKNGLPAEAIHPTQQMCV